MLSCVPARHCHRPLLPAHSAGCQLHRFCTDIIRDRHYFSRRTISTMGSRGLGLELSLAYVLRLNFHQ